MHIQYERTGGFTGLRICKTFDTHSLPPAKAEDVSNLVNASDFFHLPDRLDSPERSVDRFQYKITITDDERNHTVQAGETAIPDQLWPLLHMLDSISRQQNLRE